MTPSTHAPVSLATRLTLLAASSFTVMAGAIIAPSLPQIGEHYATRIPNAELMAKLLLSMPALAIAIFAPISGWFVDRFGCKPLMLTGLALYMLAGTTGLYLDDIYALLTGRLLLGVAVAMVMTSTTTLISSYFHGPDRGRFLGLQATAMALGGVVFLPLGGLLAHTAGWRLPFALYFASIPVLLIALKTITEPKRYLAGETIPQTGEYPIAIRWPVIGLIYGIAFVGMVAFYLGPPQLPFYMKTQFGVSPIIGSLSVATITLFAAISSMQYGRLSRMYGTQPLIIAFFVLLGSGFAVVGFATEEMFVWPGFMIAGIGGGVFTPTLSNWLLRVAPPAYRGRLSGGMISAMFAGQFLSPILIYPLIDLGGVASAFFYVGLLMVTIGACYTVILQWKKRRPARISTLETAHTGRAVV
jgi:MFS family permease